MKIALVHEFLNQLGGAERVLQNFLEIWPDATIHVLLYDPEKTHGEFEKFSKKISVLNTFPGAKRFPKFLLPWMPRAIESFEFKDFDAVLSDSSSFAHAANAKNKLHICYCHTPARFLWTESEAYLTAQQFHGIFKLIARLFLPGIRKWDRQTAARPNFYIANSRNVQQRIKKYFDRDSTVIFPPADTDFFHPVAEKKDYYFMVSRLEPYKQTRLAVEAFNELGLPLKIAGAGSELATLKKIAKNNIEFLGRVADDELRVRYSEAKAFIFPAEEDAGITVVEAMACATPVIAYGAGGALESVKAGITGEFFSEQTAGAIVSAVKNFDPKKYDSQAIRTHAQQFDRKVFQKKIKEFVEEKYNENRA